MGTIPLARATTTTSTRVKVFHPGVFGVRRPWLETDEKLLVMPLPPCLPPERLRFNWETTAWGRTHSDEAH
jgi:hypothetical protein